MGILKLIKSVTKSMIGEELAKQRRQEELRKRAKADIERIRSKMGTGVKTAGCILIAGYLSGCSYQVLTGEQGYEWSIRANPVSKSEEQHEFKPRVITFGSSRMSYDEAEMPK